MRFEKMFKPVTIGTVQIENRIVMAAMANIGLVGRHGGLTQRGIDYYAERAFGGVGLIITGINRVTEMEPRFWSPFVSWESFPSFSELAEAVHYYGSRVFAQLTAAYGGYIHGRVIDRGFTPISSSALPAYWRPDVICRALTTEEVEEIVKAFGNAAELLRAAGIDGIELQGYGGYFLDQFTAAIWNNRTDKYSGGLKGRLELPIEILNAIKDKAGKDFPVIYRYSVKHYMKGPRAGALKHEHYVEAGRDIEEGLEMAKLLEKAGFDALDLTAGCYDSAYWAYPPTYQPHGTLVDVIAEVKKCVNIPVIAVGKLDIPNLAEQVLREGKADMIALGRGLLADPHWPKKVREGKLEDIRPCLGCNDGCLSRISDYEFKPLSCAVNPATGKERLSSLNRVKQRKKILIAGGGVAGMEAARVSAIQGHEVILCEKSDRLGGHLIAASVPEFKLDIRRLLDWYDIQLKKLGIDIRLLTPVTSELIKEEKPDTVIVATGSTPIIPDISGIGRPIVVTCTDLLLGKRRAGKRVVVVGGGLVGCETALWLADQDKKVTIIEALPMMMAGKIFHANRSMLLDMLRNKQVELVTNARMVAVEDEAVSFINTELSKETIMCDTLVLALGLTPCRELYETLRGERVELYMIGDCKEPRKIMDAIWDAYHVAGR